MDYLSFFYAITKVKQIIRTGWKREGVRSPESVADHSFGITVLAMVFADQCESHLNREKLMKMALIHDIGELGNGDNVVDRGPRLAKKQILAEKHEKEKQRIKEIFRSIGKEEEYAVLFDEMLLMKTPEAQIIKQLDKLEMVMQAHTYEKEQGKNLKEFFTNADVYIKDPMLREIFMQLVKERKKDKRDGIDTASH